MLFRSFVTDLDTRPLFRLLYLAPGVTRLTPDGARSTPLPAGAPSGRLLHEGGVLLADSRVYSTKVRGSCSTDNPWPVQPHPRAVRAQRHRSDHTRSLGDAVKRYRHPETPPVSQMCDVSDAMSPETLRIHETSQRPQPSRMRRWAWTAASGWAGIVEMSVPAILPPA